MATPQPSPAYCNGAVPAFDGHIQHGLDCRRRHGPVFAGAVHSPAQAKVQKPLVFTQRAIRIRAVGALLTLAVILAITLLYKWDNIWYVIAVASVGMYCASHIITIAACWLLSPVERHINRHYYRDAERRLQAMPGLKVIGITGSYGKTSTKHYLETILSEHFDVLMTPGSYNTTMGVIRTVREYSSHTTKYSL